MKNSKRSRSSKKPAAAAAPRGVLDFVVVAIGLAILSGATLWWCLAHDWLLYFGDAVSHLNTARRVVDSRTPGIDQLGSPWLPLPHLLMMPFVTNDSWWRSGLAGGIPSAVCFVLAGVFFYGSVRLAFDSRTAGAAAVALFALNPNVLYMQSIPMTEMVLFATVTGLLFCTLWFQRRQSLTAVAAAAFFANAAVLSRYEAWLLLPAVALYFLWAARERKLLAAGLFSVLAAIGPLAWLAYNAYYSGNPLDFYNGPYSAKAIYQRALDANMARAPGDHDWAKAFTYYFAAARLCAGTSLVILGCAGLVAAVLKRAAWPLLLLLLPCGFYVLGLHSTGNPIFVPDLWPNSYYNTRYGLGAILVLALGGGALVAVLPERLRFPGGVAVVALAVMPWLLYPRPDAWICWKESQVNSEARRQWTAEAAAYMKEHYQPGQGIFTSFGDLTGIIAEAGIPIRETLYDGNNPAWLGAVTRPNLLLHEEWAVALAGDSVATAVQRMSRTGPHYRLVRRIVVKDAPVVEIYKRD